jgi:plastocyanin
MRGFRSLVLAAVLALASSTADAAPQQYLLTLQDHVFRPAVLKVRAGARVQIRVVNRDATPEEFESTDLNREQVVLPKHSIVVCLGPLAAGTYTFFGDFHRDTAQGRLVAEE